MINGKYILTAHHSGHGTSNGFDDGFIDGPDRNTSHVLFHR